MSADGSVPRLVALMSGLQAALALAERGFRVFPLPSGKKLPPPKGWQAVATSDVGALLDTWPAASGHNVGIATGWDFIVIDVDVRHGGLESLARLNLPPTFTVRTASGGLHLYYRIPKGVFIANSVSKLAPGIDVRGVSGYVVGPGSKIGDVPYRVESNQPGEMVDLPAQFVEQLSTTVRRAPDAGKAVVELDTSWALEECRKYIASRPISHEGTRDDAAFKLVCRLYDFGITWDACREMLVEWAETRCEPNDFTDDDYDRLASSGIRSRGSAIGSAHPARPFNPVDHPATEGTPDQLDPDMSVLQPEPPAPAFPLEALGRLAGWVEQQALARSAPVDYVAAGLLTAAAALIGNSRRAHGWGVFNQPPILWSLLVGAPSSRKSPALDAALEPLKALEADLAKGYALQLAHHENRVALAKAAEKASKDKAENGRVGPPPSRPRIIVQDATPEAVGVIHGENPRGLILARDEAAGFLDFDRYSSGAATRAFYIEAFGGGPYSVDRRNAGGSVNIPALSISIVACIQPEVLRECLKQGSDDGLAARFLYFWAPPVPFKRVDEYPDPKQIQTIYGRLHSLSGDKVKVPLISEAKTALDKWYQTHDRKYIDQGGRFGSALGKMSGAVLRLSLILEFLAWAAGTADVPPIEISNESVARAITLVDRYFIPMLRRVHGDASLSDLDRDTAILAKAIRERCKPEKPEIKLRTVRKEWGLSELGDSKRTRERAIDRIASAAKALVEAGWLRPKEHLGAGRPSDAYVVNPKVFLA